MNQHFKSVFKSIKDLLPYLLLISIYFFFINIEARNEKDKNNKQQIKNVFNDNNLDVQDKIIRIKIPIIPYNK